MFFISNSLAEKYIDDAFPVVIGARAPAMGNAYTSIPDDPAAIWYNPGNLSLLEKTSMLFHYEDRYNLGIRYDLIGLTTKRNQTTFGLGLQRIQVDDNPDTRDLLFDYGLDGIPNTHDAGEGNGIPDHGESLNYDEITFSSDLHWMLTLAAARKLKENLGLGIALKYLSHSIFEHHAWGIGLDAGLLWIISPEWKLGLNLRNFPTTFVSWDTGNTEQAYPYLLFGVSRWINWESSKLILTSDLEFRGDDSGNEATGNLGPISWDVKLGAEFVLREIIALRVGSDSGQFGVGFGLKMKKVSLDYGFYTHDTLGETSRFGFCLNL
jgi:hypothetical protein